MNGAFRQKSKQQIVPNASIITLKLEEENRNPETSFGERLRSLSSNIQSSDISPSHSVKGSRFKGNFKLALSKQKKQFYRSYYQKMNHGEVLSEDVKSTFEEFKRKDRTEGGREKLNEPLGIFNTNSSFQQGGQLSYNSHEAQKFHFRRKLINSLIKKIATSDDQEEDDPYELHLKRYQTQHSLANSPSSKVLPKQPVGMSQGVKELPLSSIHFSEDYLTEERRVENHSPGDSPSRLEEKYSTSAINKESTTARRSKPILLNGKSPERRVYFPKQAAVMFGNPSKKEELVLNPNYITNLRPVLKIKRQSLRGTNSAHHKSEIISFRTPQNEKSSFTTQQTQRRPSAKQKPVQLPVKPPRNDTASLLTLFLQQRKISMDRGQYQGRRIVPLGASRIGNCLKIQNVRQRGEYKI